MNPHRDGLTSRVKAVFFAAALRVAALGSATALVAQAPAPQYHVTFGGVDSGATPVIAENTNWRLPDNPPQFWIVVDPPVDPQTPVHWSIPDGKNSIVPTDFFNAHMQPVVEAYDTTLDGKIAIHPQPGGRGDAVIVADVGPPVNARYTLHVVDRLSIGFGCYDFIAGGPSVRIVNGIVERTTLADADVAVVGPQIKPWPLFYGCTGENVDPTSTAYRLVFKTGGRAADSAGSQSFVKTLPYETVARAHALDVKATDGRVYRLHLSALGRTYFVGWMEPIDPDPS